MKEIIFMVITLLFLVSCGDISNNNTSSSANNTGGGSGIYGLQITKGDILLNPAKEILIKENDKILQDQYIDLTERKSITFSSLMQPSAAKNASMFEVISSYSDSMSSITSCHTGAASNNCSSTYTFLPKCNGTVTNILRLRVDKAPPKNLSIGGQGQGFKNECLPDVSDNTTYTLSESSHTFKTVNEIFHFTIYGNKPVNNGYKLSANGTYNGFYYSYACFYNDNNCHGFIQFTGKVGKHDCKGYAELRLSINPVVSKHDGQKLQITVNAGGAGRNDNVTCSQIEY